MNVVTSGMPSNKPMLHIVMDDELLARIDDYRYVNRIPSRSEAVRQLIERSLTEDEAAHRARPHEAGGQE